MTPVLTLARAARRAPGALLLLAALSSLGSAIPASADDESVLLLQRLAFQEAIAAVVQRDSRRYERALALLQDYPLVDYVQYRWLRAGLGRGEDLAAEVDTYLQRYPGRFAERLRRERIARLQREGDWRQVLLNLRPQHSDRDFCLALTARTKLGERLQWEPPLWKFWKRPGALPERCKEPFARLTAAYPPTTPMVWERINLAMEGGYTGTASELAGYLSRADRERVKLWIKAHDDPERALGSPALAADQLMNRRIVRHAIQRLAQRDAEQARAAWEARKGAYVFSAGQAAEIDRYIALRASYQHRAPAYEWLSAVPEEYRTRGVHAWRARAALVSEDWVGLGVALAEMPLSQRSDEGWQYWYARALMNTGRERDARALFAELASETTYYGFLAADRLGQAYRFNNQPVQIDEQRMQAVAANHHVVRAREFLWLDLTVEARREWRAALGRMSEADKLAAALLAHDWDWHDRAVYTVAGTSFRGDYALRFPMPFAEHVSAAARDFTLEPALIYGVLRRESAYRADARSRAGALGLMQLMPGTARGVARALGTQVQRADLLRPATNIRFGSKYFRDMLDRFGENQALAAAAYNAGPHRVQRWLPRERARSADAWVDTLPFRETRGYVRAVLAYATIFEWRRGLPVTRLSARMPPVPVIQGG